MTVIAWDGKTLAADTISISIDSRHKVKKIWQVHDDEWAALLGDYDHGMAMVNWYKSGAVESQFPEFQTDRDGYTQLVIATRGVKTIKAYHRTPVPMPFFDKKISFGSGRDFADTAMHLGKDAVAAVKVAIALCNSCGGGVDYVRVNKT